MNQRRNILWAYALGLAAAGIVEFVILDGYGAFNLLLGILIGKGEFLADVLGLIISFVSLFLTTLAVLYAQNKEKALLAPITIISAVIGITVTFGVVLFALFGFSLPVGLAFKTFYLCTEGTVFQWLGLLGFTIPLAQLAILFIGPIFVGGWIAKHPKQQLLVKFTRLIILLLATSSLSYLLVKSSNLTSKLESACAKSKK